MPLLLFVAVESFSEIAVGDLAEDAPELLFELTEFRFERDRRLNAAAEYEEVDVEVLLDDDGTSDDELGLICSTMLRRIFSGCDPDCDR